MSEPDIIIPIPGTDLQAFVWIDAVEITRQGQRQTPGMDDRWKLGLPIRASLAKDGQILTDASGNEFACQVPEAIRARVGGGIDLARIAHHPEVAAAMATIRDLCIRLATGDLEIAP